MTFYDLQLKLNTLKTTVSCWNLSRGSTQLLGTISLFSCIIKSSQRTFWTDFVGGISLSMYVQFKYAMRINIFL